MKLPTYQELSKEQDRINGLPLDGNWLVTGPPGTGKTVMALYRAQMLKHRARPVSIIVWSRILRMYVQEALGELDLDPDSIRTFDSWLHNFWRSNQLGTRQVPYQGDNRWNYDWDAIHHALDVHGVPKGTPDLIIDEGQDLPNGLYLFVRNLCDHLTVFADEDQTVGAKGQSSVKEIQRLARIKDTFELRSNYRNSRPIAELAHHFFAGRPDALPDLPPTDRTGPPPVTRAFGTWRDSAARIATWSKNHDGETVGVFTPNVASARKMARELDHLGAPNVQVYHRTGRGAPDIDFTQPGVLVSHFMNSKGLEFDAVFVAELQASQLPLDDPLTHNILYVLTSRARTHLEFHWSGAGRPALLTLFPADLAEAR